MRKLDAVVMRVAWFVVGICAWGTMLWSLGVPDDISIWRILAGAALAMLYAMSIERAVGDA